MNQILLKAKKLQRFAKDWTNRVNPRVDYLIDKYKLIKVVCLIGIGINCYLIYDGIMNIIVLKKVQREVDLKKNLFYRRVQNKKQQVMALMQQLQQDNLLPTNSEHISNSI